MKVSIIIPTYNRAYTLDKTISSILKQTYHDWEMIVVDDGSVDDTQKLVNSFKDTRIHYMNQQNAGPAAARNLGMKHATGALISFVDSDDPLYVDYLETIVHYFKNPTITFALSHCDMFYELYDESGHLLSRKSAESEQSSRITVDDLFHWRKRVAIGTGLTFRRKMFVHKIKWREDIFPGDDIEFVMQLLELDSTGFAYITPALFEYNQKYGGDGVCSNTDYLQWARMFEDIYNIHKHSSFLTDPNEYHKRIKKYRKKQEEFEMGNIVAPKFKYFPEFSND